MVYLLNLCVKEGCMPDFLKTSLIIPIYKTGPKTDLANYRPISLLSYIDKALEKAIHSRLYKFLSKNEFFCKNQFGFRENHSTELALLSLTERIYEAVDNKKYVIIVSVDLRKAFDVIQHDILLDKLENLGIRGFMLKWFSAYLKNRTQKTIVNQTVSHTLPVKCGVPQGSSLGPLLFLIYLNDIKNIFKTNEINIFADDTISVSYTHLPSPRDLSTSRMPSSA